MARSSDATRQQIIEAAYELFYSKGFTRVGVELIAEKAMLTKRTLYNHFPSKDELLAAVLQHRHGLALQRIRSWGAAMSGRPLGAALDSLFTELAGWASKPRWSGAGFTRLVMELAEMPGHPARSVARRHKAAIEAFLSDELARRRVADAPNAARQLMVLLEGTMVMMLITGESRYAPLAAKAAKDLLKAPA